MAGVEVRSGEQVDVGPAAGRDSIAEAVGALSQGMNSLVKGHLALARVEMARDLKALGRDAAVELAGVPMLLASYLLLWIGIGYLLALALPTWASFLICAGANLLGGLALMAWGYAMLKKQKVRLPASTEEVRRDRELAAHLRESPPQLRGSIH